MGASSWSALNKACAADALIIHVAAGVTGPEVFVESTVEAGVVAHPRFIVSLGAGASLKLTQTFDGEGNSASNVWTTFNLGANATLKHASVAAGHVHLEHVSASLLDGASFSSSTVSFEADFARVGVDVAHDGAYSTSSLKGLQLGAARQALDYRTQVRHEAPNCDSFQDIRNVVGGNAHVTFKGRIAVPRLGQKTDAKQLCRSLLLSDDCTLDAMPSLEIVADDVKCAHGATVADLDDDMYFYLISRGLDTQEAKALLVRGFCGSILQAIEAETPLPTSTLSNFNSKLEALVKLEAKA
ncbi:hypothetical protein M885DRAFT_434490 [Pelagophyceae sp. CCMP2097]|nr:hypothetical protein M885DRAFT_434490 [Pelagophyceae sp. CCMP2097]